MTRTLVALAAAGTFTWTSPAAAQQPDMAAIMKWSNVKVVRYHIVGVFKGATVIADDKGNASAQATVADRVVLDVDWDVSGGKAIGAAKVTNEKSTVAELRNIEPKCAAPVPEGDYEHLDVTEVVLERERLQLKGTRAFPAVKVTDCQGMTETRNVPAGKQPVIEYVAVPAPMLLAVPMGGNQNIAVSADKKSFTIATETWTWTYTPTMVR